MQRESFDAAMHYVYRLAGVPEPPAASDGELLRRFVQHQDADAFAVLLHRHGPLVLGACRRILNDAHAAEDAFQATFLVLARKARGLHGRTSLAGWLLTVACRAARRARRTAESIPALVDPPSAAADPLQEISARELCRILDEELERLPERYRAPVLLCCLEGKSRDEAARELGWTENAVKGRLQRGRECLRHQLERRGVTLSAALLTVSLTQLAAAQVPASLLQVTASAALAILSGTAGAVSGNVATLVESVLHGMLVTKLKIASGAIILAVLAIGVGVYTHAEERPAAAAPVLAQQPGEEKPAEEPTTRVRVDRHGDPLPEGAVARLGTVRLRAPGSHIAISADGKTIVAVNSESVVRRFDAASGDLTESIQLPHYGWDNNWLSPCGTYVLAPRHEGRNEGCHLDLFDSTSGEKTASLDLGLEAPTCEGASFSADESRIAVAYSCGEEQRVRVWDWKTGKTHALWTKEIRINSRFFKPVAVLSPDGKRVVASHYDQAVRCWEVDGGKLLWEVKDRNYSALIFFSPDGNTVVTQRALLDAATGTVRRARTSSSPDSKVYPIGYSPDGRFLVCQTGSESLLLWDIAADKPGLELPRPPRQRDQKGSVGVGWLARTHFAFASDGRTLVTLNDVLQRWDVETGKPVFAQSETWGHAGAVTKLVFSPDGSLLASCAKDQTVRLWDVAKRSAVHLFPKGLPDQAAFTPDGRSLLARPFAIVDNIALRKWNTSTGREERAFDFPERPALGGSSADKELLITSDGGKVLMLSMKNGRTNDESMLSIWSTADGKNLAHKRVPWGEESAITPDGKSVLAVDTRSGAVRLLDLESEREQVRFQFAPSGRRTIWGSSLTISPNARFMAARLRYLDPNKADFEDDDIRIGSLATGQQLLTAKAEGTSAFAFSADDRLFGVVDAAGLRLWETAVWKPVGSIPTGVGEKRLRTSTQVLAFSPDHRAMATGHADGSILLWSTSLGDTKGQPAASEPVDSLWRDLRAADAAKSHCAIWRLVDVPERSLPFLKKALLEPADRTKPISQLIADLDSDKFPVREAASKELAGLLLEAEAALQKTLTGKPSAECRQRIEALLASAADLDKHPDILRAMRALAVIEYIATPEAQDLLRTLLRDAPPSLMTREAEASLTRLGRRPGKMP